MTEFTLQMGDIIFRFYSELSLSAKKSTKPFIAKEKSYDCRINVFEKAKAVPQAAKRIGRDYIFYYYKCDKFLYAKAIPEKIGSISTARYCNDFSNIDLFVDEKTFPEIVRSLDKVIQLTPIRKVLSYHDAWILHSSRIGINDKAILFSGPSGVGKTTQSRLWNKFENTPVMCNDRTVIRHINDTFYTYGFPIDGSSPVYSNKKVPLGAIVILRQGTENSIEHLRPLYALKYLIEQTVADSWDKQEIIKIQMLWMDLLEKIPVYMFKCKPEKDAVVYLKKKLIEDGVL